MRPKGYTAEELVHRPIEHIVEALSCRDLSAGAGCGHTKAGLVRNGRAELTPLEEQRIYDWLRSDGAGMVWRVTDKRTPARANSRGMATIERAVNFSLDGGAT